MQHPVEKVTRKVVEIIEGEVDEKERRERAAIGTGGAA